MVSTLYIYRVRLRPETTHVAHHFGPDTTQERYHFLFFNPAKKDPAPRKNFAKRVERGLAGGRRHPDPFPDKKFSDRWIDLAGVREAALDPPPPPGTGSVRGFLEEKAERPAEDQRRFLGTLGEKRRCSLSSSETSFGAAKLSLPRRRHVGIAFELASSKVNSYSWLRACVA